MWHVHLALNSRAGRPCHFAKPFAKNLDISTPGAGLPPHEPRFEALVQLPATLTQITFGVNLKGVQPGEACIFHLTQTFKNFPQGGLTLVLLKR